MSLEDETAAERGADGRELTRRETLQRGGVLGFGGLVTAAAGTPSSASGAPPVEWTRTYDHGTLTRVDEVARAPDGGYAFVGGDGPAAAAAVDGDGTLRWIRAFEELPGDPTTLIADDGGLILGLSNADAPHLARLAPSCDVAWTVTFPEPATGVPAEYRPHDIAPTPDGGYVVVGTHPLGAGDPVQWAAKVDAGGEVEWSELYATCGVFVGVVPASAADGAADYVVGAGFIDDCDGTPSASALRGLTADGDVAWTTTYPAGGTTDEVEYLSEFVRTADGGFALAGTRNDGTTVVRKADSDRSPEWTRAYDGPPVTSLVTPHDGGLAFAGSFTWYFTTVEASLTRLDASGDVRWQDTYTVEGRPASITSLVAPHDGGFVFGGAAEIRESEQGAPAYLTKLEPESGDAS